MITGEQIKEARVVLNLSQFSLAQAAAIDFRLIVDAELGRAISRDDLIKIKLALESAGVEFTNGGQPGVRLRASAKTIDAGAPRQGKSTARDLSRRE